MKKPSLRVYFVSHSDGRKTGILMRTTLGPLDGPAHTAYGLDEEDVLSQLEVLLRAGVAGGEEPVGPYLWLESFSMASTSVEIHPQSVVGGHTVIGARSVRLKLSYAHSKHESGAFRIALPRFGWWFAVERLELASEILRTAVSGALLGESASWLYDFRHEGEEYIREWSPPMLSQLIAGYDDDDDEDDEVHPTLRTVAQDLVERAKQGKLPPVLDAGVDLSEHAGFYSRSPPESILLVGPSGVGKSTFVKKLARYFARPSPKHPRGTAPRIWSTSRERMVAGMIYLGMWQERCLAVLAELQHEGHYLHIDRLASWVEPLADGTSLADLMTPAVVAKEISVIAECSEAELERCRRKAPEFVNALRIIRLTPTEPDQMPALLTTYLGKRGGRGRISPDGLKLLVRYLDAFARDASFPGKGFRFVDWLVDESRRDADRALDAGDVSRIYSRYSGLPVELISDAHAAHPDAIAEKLRARVIGQEAACAAAGRVLARFKAGLDDPSKPCGSLLFVGPTGVGKTELAKQLARYMFSDEKRLVRLDMSEYMLPGSARRLLETGPGSRSLADRIREQPLSLVLLDEIEKAHPEVFDLLLGVLGEGRLTDSYGRFVDFRMTLVVMTSNLGASEKSTVGFEGGPRDDHLRSVRDFFRPELLNRIDHVVPFRALTRADVEQIVSLVIEELGRRTGLVRRRLTLAVSEAARRKLAADGYHPTRGARPLRRLVEDRVISPLAVHLARDPDLKDAQIPVLTAEEAADSRHTGLRFLV